VVVTKGFRHKVKAGRKGPKGRPPKFVVAPTSNLQVANLRGKVSELLVAFAPGQGTPYDYYPPPLARCCR